MCHNTYTEGVITRGDEQEQDQEGSTVGGEWSAPFQIKTRVGRVISRLVRGVFRLREAVPTNSFGEHVRIRFEETDEIFFDGISVHKCPWRIQSAVPPLKLFLHLSDLLFDIPFRRRNYVLPTVQES